MRGCFKLAKAERSGFLIKDGLLYRKERVLGQPFLQLVVPPGRREHVLKMGHSICGGHMAAKRTKTRIELSFWWPNLLQSCKDFIKCCRECQLKACVSFRDRVPIKAIPGSDRVFDHFFIDIAGPFFPNEGQKPKYNYALIAVDSASRFPATFALSSITARNVCYALLQLWQFTGCCSHVSSDTDSNSINQLTREFHKRMGCATVFSSPYHPSANGLAERSVGNVKTIISRVATDHPKQWHTYLPMIMWCLREVPNETTGVDPWTLVMGHLPRGPLAILKESWCGERKLPISLGKNAVDCVEELHKN